MSPAPGKDIWSLMLDTASRRLSEAEKSLAGREQLEVEELRALSASLFCLEASCWIAGAEPLGEACRHLRRMVPSGSPLSEDATEAVGRGIALVGEVVSEMTGPDPDEAKVIDILKSIEQLGADWSAPPEEGRAGREAGEGTGRQPAGEPEGGEQPFGVWVPEVDEEMVPPFVEECTDRLQSLSEKLIDLEARPDDRDLLASVFRDLHTVKGSSAFVGLSPLNRLAHRAEDLVGELREGRRRADGPVVDSLLTATDVMTEILERAVDRVSLEGLSLEEPLRRLENPYSRPPARAAASGPPEQPPRQRGASLGSTGSGGGGRATIRVDFSKLDVLLNLVGELVLDRAAVHTVLENFQSAVRALESPRRQLGRHRRSLAPLGSDHRPSPARSRADLPAIHEEIDRLERIFRELSRELDVAAGSLDFVAGELRDQVMKLRMVPISQVFSKHRRTVRDLARTLEKEVKVEIKGEETELDKMLVEKLDEPLMHMVRNAVDHGIESPEQRREASKPEQGTVKLEAKHRGGQLVVEISDDGKGLDPEKIRSKAVERGLLTAEQAEELDDHDALRLIFAPGFSTAKEVTDLSGRGVGMDVVHDAMRKLRGSADVTSVPGASTTFTLSLPLTLAIRQVLLMRVAGELLALPLDNVERTVDIEPHQVREVADRQVLEEASGPLPLVWLEEALGLGPMRSAERRPRNVVCVEVLGRRYGLVCDSLEGKREIVVKTLGDILVRAECAAGGTLVGNRVVIILDLPAVVSRWQGSARSGLARRQAVHQTSDAPAARRVLVAEDSPPARQLLCDLFRKLGFAVVEAADGEQALFELERHHFDLISTDARMPHMDGYELTRRLRHEPRTKNTPVLMISARGERVDKVRGFDAGVDAYLVKPTDAAELAEAVSRLLKTSKRGGAEMEEEP